MHSSKNNIYGLRTLYCGLFPIVDGKVFYNIFFIVINHDILHLQITGAIVTYLIFLIQFALASNKALSTVNSANGINGTINVTGTGIVNVTG